MEEIKFEVERMIPTDLVIMQFDVKKRIIYPFNLTKHRPINTLPKAKA